MTTTGQSVTMWKGDSHIITIEITDSAGAPVDLSGATARWWMGKNNKATGDNIYIQKTASITNVGPQYSLVIELEPEDTEDLVRTGTFYHEAEVIDSTGNVSTVMVGSFVLMPAIITPAP